jgi:type IV pilus assembly protein PilC
MPVFTYTATDSSGGKRTGIVDARTQPIAVGLLKQQGLYVISLQEKQTSVLDAVLDFGGISYSEVVTFTRQFSTMLSAGLPLSRALEVLAEQSGSRGFRKVIFEILRAVEGGASLSEGLGKHPKVFSSTYQALVKAGESSGKLDDILKRLAMNMESERELENKFKAAMIYPAIVFIAMIGVYYQKLNQSKS